MDRDIILVGHDMFIGDTNIELQQEDEVGLRLLHFKST